MPSGLVSNIQKYCLEDGPGIRTSVFLKGCPLHCAWCHNPENISRRPEVVVFEARCVRCGGCLEVCPLERRSPTRRDHNQVDRAGSETGAPFLGTAHRSGARMSSPAPPATADCKLCGACVEACPTGARVMLGKEMSVAHVLAQILTDRIFYDDSGGGVTFSGGEPLMQFEFLREVLEACRGRGVHTAVDTCGFTPPAHLLEIARFADLFLYDLKFMDEERHQEFTGVSNKPILDNLRALGDVHQNIWLRIPIIPGVNDDASQLDAMARLARAIPGLRQINLLPYHRAGMHKHKRLGQEYRLAGLASPSPEYMEAVAARFATLGVTVKAGG